ncbi:MAG: transposase [bacterium]|nr:transposase [bacterium]
MTNDQREIHRKKRVLEYAERIGNINKACRYFGVARSTFYLWRERYRESGDEGLRSRRCGPHNHPNKTPDDVVEKFPFRIRPIRTDRGHEFQALIHWHVADLGMEHVYIKPRTPQLNGKVERSHRTDKDEFYQLLTYRDDVDLEKKLATWENFYNFDRPHGAHGGKTPYEALREKLS